SPGSTILPVTSTTSRAPLGGTSDCTTAILPSRTATSFRPSTPEAGSITRPPRKSRSKLVLTDTADLLSRLARRLRAAAHGEANIVFGGERHNGDQTNLLGAPASPARHCPLNVRYAISLHDRN